MLLIYLPEITSRCNYVFDLIFEQELGIQYDTTADITTFQNYAGQKINYSNSRFTNEFFIKSTTLLFEKEIKAQRIPITSKHQTRILFPNENCDLGFDIFSSVFYLVSRYEEYLPSTQDEYGRFRAQDSLAFKNDFLHLPVVNIWINIFSNFLQKKFPSLKLNKSIFKAILTYDVDVAYKYSGRSFVRTFGSAIKDVFALNIRKINERIKVLNRNQKDPWDTFEDLKQIILTHNLTTIFFFLMSDKSAHDRNLNHKNPAMKRLINYIESFAGIGIHPSFYSSLIPNKITIEKKRLEKISGKIIVKSRQHYLKFILPDTYNYLITAGITEDYSMGFAGVAGFRAGTCKPFYFYDLKEEKQTHLKIFPITFMEGTMINLSLNPGEALENILSLLKEVRNVGGTFISIWHNQTISKTDEYEKWRTVHEKMITELVQYL